MTNVTVEPKCPKSYYKAKTHSWKSIFPNSFQPAHDMSVCQSCGMLMVFLIDPEYSKYGYRTSLGRAAYFKPLGLVDK